MVHGQALTVVNDLTQIARQLRAFPACGDISDARWTHFYVHAMYATYRVEVSLSVNNSMGISVTAHFHERGRQSDNICYTSDFVQNIANYIYVTEQKERVRTAEKRAKDQLFISHVRKIHAALKASGGFVTSYETNRNIELRDFIVNVFRTNPQGDLRVRFHHKDKRVTRDTTHALQPENGWWLDSMIVAFKKEVQYATKRLKALELEQAAAAVRKQEQDLDTDTAHKLLCLDGWCSKGDGVYTKDDSLITVTPVYKDPGYVLVRVKPCNSWTYSLGGVCRAENVAQDVAAMVAVSKL